MAEKKFSELTTAATLGNDDIFALSQMDSGSLASKKTTLTAIANHINTVVQYTNAYGTQAKTTAGAINELKQLISLIPQFSIEVVQELPTEDISDTTIYLVPAEDPEVGNYYEEYIYVNNTWELVGTTAVDLSAYYTKLEVDGLLATKASVTEVALKENKSDMPTDVRMIIKDCKTPKSATITNGIAQFECIEENLVKGLKVTMNPIQDLHGQSTPYPAGGGKNKLPLTLATIKSENTSGTWSDNVYTHNHIDFTVQTDDGGNVIGIYANGTAAGGTAVLRLSQFELTSDSYIFNGLSNAGSLSTFRLIFTGAGYTPGHSTVVSVNGNTINPVSGTTYGALIAISSGAQVSNELFKPMIRLATVTDATFAPYSNICPISGRTEASVKRTGVNIWGGETLADDIVAKVASATKNTTEKTVSYSASNIDSVVLFSKLEPNKQYTAIVTMKSGVPNMAFVYTDNTKTTIGAGVTVSTAGKTVKRIEGSWVTGNSVMYYDQSGIFEGVKTADDFEPYTAETHTHQYGQTVYGGVDDFVNGGATSTMGMVDLGDLTWTYTNGIFRSGDISGIPTLAYDSDLSKFACSCYKAKERTATWANIQNGEYGFVSKQMLIKDDAYTDATNFKTAVTGQTLCYELATPTTIETSAEDITTVSGTNIISGTEPISECKYTELATVDDLIKIIGGQ